jgi:hypothetical protein
VRSLVIEAREDLEIAHGVRAVLHHLAEPRPQGAESPDLPIQEV